VRVLQLSSELDLTPEPLHVDACSQLRQEHLHNHLAAQRTLERQEDAGHAAAP
jgi:hypothetical protein